MAKKKNAKVKEAENSFEKLIKNADEGIIITATNGHVEVTGIKNVNYAHQAKGLLVGALDSYKDRAALNALNSLNKNIHQYVQDAVNPKKPAKKKEDK